MVLGKYGLSDASAPLQCVSTTWWHPECFRQCVSRCGDLSLAMCSASRCRMLLFCDIQSKMWRRYSKVKMAKGLLCCFILPTVVRLAQHTRCCGKQHTTKLNRKEVFLPAVCWPREKKQKSRFTFVLPSSHQSSFLVAETAMSKCLRLPSCCFLSFNWSAGFLDFWTSSYDPARM